MSELAKQQCKPCQGGVPPLTSEQIKPLLEQINAWDVVENHHLEKTYTFPDFAHGLDFVNRIGTVAEMQQHHPDLYLAWGKVTVKIWTHKINGLTESDFIFAAKCDVCMRGMQAALERRAN